MSRLGIWKVILQTPETVCNAHIELEVGDFVRRYTFGFHVGGKGS